MIKFKNFKNIVEVKVELDEYIFLSSTWGKEFSEIYYYRVFSKDDCFLELSFNSNDGSLYSLKIITSNKYFDETRVFRIDNSNIEIGHPCFILDSFINSKYFDDNSEFYVFVGEDSISFLFNSDNNSKYLIRNGRTIFGFNSEKELNIISIEGFSSSEINEFKSYYII